MSHPIIEAISNPEVIRDSEKLLALLSGLKSQLTNNHVDISEVISPLVKLVATNNSMVKAQVCDLVILAAGKEPDIGLLVVNLLNKDVKDPNPLVRSTAITTICSLPVLLAYSNSAIVSGLQDVDPTVRVSSVTGVGKVWRHSPEHCHTQGLVDRLYQVLRDNEPSVVTFAIQTLNVILEQEGGIVINSNMVRYFLARLDDFKESELCFLLDFLAIPKMEDDLRLEMLNTLDPHLDKSDPNLVLGVVKLLCKLVRNHQGLKSSLVSRITPIIIAFLKSNSFREFNIYLLEFIISQDDVYIKPFKNNFKLFYLKTKDPEKLKSKKLEFLPLVATEENSMEIVNYLLNMLPHQPCLASLIIQMCVKICVIEKSCFHHVLLNLQMLIKSNEEKYVTNVLMFVDKLNLRENMETDSEKIVVFIQNLLEALDVDELSPDQLHNVFYLLQHFGNSLPSAAYNFEDILNVDKSIWSPELYSQLLSTSYILFLEYPPAMQPLVARTFDIVRKQNNHQLQQNLVFYYSLLKAKS